MDERAQRIQDAIDAITRIEDPAECALVAGQALQTLHDGNATLAETRRSAITAMRAAGATYRDIGEQLGMHHSRVAQIESGKPTGVNAKPRAADSGH